VREPVGLDRAALRVRSLNRFPLRSGESVTVPCAVDGWITANRPASFRSLEARLEPAAVLADGGR
jgi:gamma-glutamyltranspeptidase